jgi:hypothetical protein
MLEFYEDAAGSDVQAYINGKVEEFDIEKISLIEVPMTDFKPRR